MSFTNPGSQEELLSVVDVSRLAGVTDTTVRKWAKRENIPTYPIDLPGHEAMTHFSPLTIMASLISTGLPLLPLKEAVNAVGGNPAQAYVLDARHQIARIKLANGNTFYTTFGVAHALGIPNPVYIGTTKAGSLLGISRDSAARRLSNKQLPGIRLLGGFTWMALREAITPVDVEEWVRTHYVAKQWRLSSSAVHRLCRKGSLQSVLIGGRRGYYLINPEALPKAPRHPITTAEFANAMGVSPSTVNLWYQRGLVRGARLGHNLRFAKAEIKRAKSLGLGSREPQRA